MAGLWVGGEQSLGSKAEWANWCALRAFVARRANWRRWSCPLQATGSLQHFDRQPEGPVLGRCSDHIPVTIRGSRHQSMEKGRRRGAAQRQDEGYTEVPRKGVFSTQPE